MADNVYDAKEQGDSPLGLGQPPKKGAPDFEPPKTKTYPSDKDTSTKELGGGDEPEANSATKAEQSAIEAAQQEPDDRVNYTGDETDGGKNKTRGKRRFWTRRKLAIAGATSGITLLGGLFVAIPSVGVLEFLHAGESLMPHFAAMDRAGDSRMAQMYRLMVARGTSSCNGGSCIVKDGGVGDTRLNYLERRAKAQVLKDLDSVGVKAWTDRAGNYRGWTIDTAKNPEYAGLDKEQFLAKLEEQGISKAAVNQISQDSLGNIKFSVRDDHLTGFGQTKLVKVVMKTIGYSDGLWTWMSRRAPFQKFLGIGLHPLAPLDRATNRKATELYDTWKKARAAKLRTGASDTVNINTEGSGTTETDANGKTTTTKPGGTGSSDLDAPKVKSTLKTGLSNSTAIKGSATALAAAGIACMARDIYKGSSMINYVQNQRPLMALAGEIISTKGQIEAGTDMNDVSLAYEHTILESTDAKGNHTSFTDAKSIKQNNGLAGGVDLDAQTKTAVANSGKGPSWLAWTVEGASGAALTSIRDKGGLAMAGVGFIMGIVSGQAITTVVGTVVGLVAGPQIIQFIAGLVTGTALDVANAAGVTAGQYADYGALMASNLTAMDAGGHTLSTQETTTQFQTTLGEAQASFASESIAYKLFNVYDSKSVAGQLVNTAGTTGASNLARLSNSFAGITTGLFSSFGSIISHKASAATSLVPYDYGVAKIGFTNSEIESPLTADPFDNAYKVAGILDADTSGTYIEKAKVCNGVTLVKDSVSGWMPQLDTDEPFVKSLSGQLDAMCSQADESWKRIRMFILDVSQLESYACLNDIDATTSCANTGFGAAAAYSSTTPSTTGALGAATLKRAQGSWGGYTNGDIPLTALTSISAITASDGTKVSFSGCSTWMSQPYLNPSAAISFVELNKAYKAANGKSLSLESCYRDYDQQVAAQKRYGSGAATPGKSNHGWGLAIDFDNMSSYSDAGYKWLMKNGPSYGWVNPANMQQGGSGPHEPWHWEYARPISTSSSGGTGTL